MSHPLKVFRAYLKQRKLTPTKMTGAEAFAAMTDFYIAEKAEGPGTVLVRDMLLCQWGVCDSQADADFQFDITRQFIVGQGEDDEIFQLHLTLYYPVAFELKDISAGNLWCESHADIESFRTYIKETPAYIFAAQRLPKKVDLLYENAG